jgi:nickel/cobalt transporter (NiCoT) family protein
LANGKAIFTLMSLVFLLGVRHGFEPDHLAVIDGMTRCARIDNKLSKWIGFLFSLGHGLIVILIAALIGMQAERWEVPSWFYSLGAWVSILSLFFLGIINLYSVSSSHVDHGLNVKGPLQMVVNAFVKTESSSSYFSPVLLGMLFSLSFDTLSQTVAFSFSAFTLAGKFFPILLGVLFMLGMMMTDGLNGYFLAHIIHRADKKSHFISQLLGIVIGGFSLGVGIYYLLIYFK